MQNDHHNDEVLAELNGKQPFKRMSGFATSMWAPTCPGFALLMTECLSGILASWMPQFHAYYDNTLKVLHDHNPALKRIFTTSVFSATTYNPGPRTACLTFLTLPLACAL